MNKPRIARYFLALYILAIPCLIMGAFRNAFEDAASTDIVTGTTATFTGTVTAEQLTSTDDATITDDLGVGGDVTVVGTLQAEQVTSTDDLTVTDAIGCASLTASGAVQGASITDGTATLSSGSMTGVVGVTATGIVTAEQLGSSDDCEITDDLSVGGDAAITGALSGGSVSDGTATLSSGSLASAVNGTFSGTVQAEQLTSTDDASISDALSVGGIVSMSGGYCDGAPITISTTTTLTTTMHYVLIDASSNDVKIDLPAVAGVGYHAYEIKVITDPGAYTITVDGNASETIDGAATNTTLFATQWDAAKIKSDGTQWLIW